MDEGEISKASNLDGFTSAAASASIVQNQDQDNLYAFAVNDPTSVPIVTIDSTDLEKFTSNHFEIYKKYYKNLQEILNNQTLLKADYEKVLENQNSMMMTIAEISVKLDTIITEGGGPAVVKLNDTMKKSWENTQFCLKPIKDVSELSHIEEILSDNIIKKDYKLKYSIVCQPGKAANCAYQLVDVFFNRIFLTQCSWSGSARGKGTKVSLKQYKYVLNLFFELIYECDQSYTIAANEIFFKSILKNATKRKNSKLQRSSTCRNSHKRQKLVEKATKNIRLPEEGTLNNIQDVINGTNVENKENVPQEDNVLIENNVSKSNTV